VVCDILDGGGVGGDLRVKVDFRKDAVVRQLDALKGAEKRAILKRGLNRAAVTVRAKGAREIADEVGGKVTVAEIKRAILVERATNTTLTAVVKALGKKRIPLMLYSPRQTKAGVRVTIAGKTTDIAHAFITKSRGRRFVAIRAASYKGRYYDDPGYHAATKRLPIAGLYAPGVPEKFVNAKILGAIRVAGEARFREVVEQEYKYLIARTSAT
jgi:hypothetical protein